MFKKVDEEVKVSYRESSLPEILITKKAMNKMKLYIDKCDKEIGWLGVVENDSRTYLITDVILFKQEVTSVTTDICEEDLSDFANRIMQDLGSDEGMSLLNSIKMWGHSHVNMSTFASGTDDKSMEMFEDGGHDFYIRVIGNKKGIMKIDLFHYESGITYENLPFITIASEEEREIRREVKKLEEKLELLQEKEIEEIEEEIEKEIEDKVKDKVYSYSGYRGKQTSTKSKVTSLKDYDGYKNYGYNQGYYGYGLGDEYLDEGVGGKDKFADEGYMDKYVLWGIALCENADDVKELLMDYALYFNQSKEELNELMEEAKKVVGYDMEEE